MSFCSILSNTARQAPCPSKDTRGQGSANSNDCACSAMLTEMIISPVHARALIIHFNSEYEDVSMLDTLNSSFRK